MVWYGRLFAVALSQPPCEPVVSKATALTGLSSCSLRLTSSAASAAAVFSVVFHGCWNQHALEALRQIWFVCHYQIKSSIETWHCESPIHAARVTFLQLLPYPSLRDPHYEEIQSDIISAKYSFVSLLRGLEKTTKNSKKKETRKQNQATSPSLFILPIPSAHFPPNPLWQLRTSGCSAAFANPIISPKHQIDRKFQSCRARNSHERLLLWNKMNKVSTSPTLSIVDLQVFELKNKTIRLGAIWKWVVHHFDSGLTLGSNWQIRVVKG